LTSYTENIFTIPDGFCRAEFTDGPHAGEADLYSTTGTQPPGWIGRTIEQAGETAWYRLQGGHGLPGRVSYTYDYAYSAPDGHLPREAGNRRPR
jgi:hypothetical protein